MLRAVHETIRRRRLFLPGQRVLVAVSGGADSVALLYALHYFRKRLGIGLSVAHLHHGLRGRDADADAEFVRLLAWRLGLPFFLERQDVAALARRRGISVEMAAREARYGFFVRAAAEAGADVVATAHTADDQAETLLLRIVRGTGPQGLGGMAHRSRRGRLELVRPMLDVTHAEAVGFLQRHRRRWREDLTNLDTGIARNWVRHELLPLLERRLNPGARRALVRLAGIMREETAWSAALAARELRGCASSGGRLDAKKLAGLPLAVRRRVVHAWLLDGGIDPAALDFDAVERVLELAEGRAGSKSVPVASDRAVTRRYGALSLGAPAAGDVAFHVSLRVPGETRVADRGWIVTVERTRGYVRPPRSEGGKLPARVSISRAAVGSSPLVLRSWRAGDRIAPVGMAGSRKVQDILVDAKVPRDERPAVPVLACRGEVVWVAGYRVARGWRVPGPGAPSLTITVARGSTTNGHE